MKNLQKVFAIPLIIAIIALLLIVGVVYLYNSNKNTDPYIEEYTYSEGQIIKVSDRGDNFNEKVIQVRYFNNDKFVLFNTLTYDIKTYYLINRLTGDDLLIGKNKYLTTDLLSEKEIRYIDEKNVLVIKTYTNDLLGDGFNGVLVINLENNSVNKTEVKRNGYSQEEDERIVSEVNRLFSTSL